MVYNCIRFNFSISVEFLRIVIYFQVLFNGDVVLVINTLPMKKLSNLTYRLFTRKDSKPRIDYTHHVPYFLAVTSYFALFGFSFQNTDARLAFINVCSLLIAAYLGRTASK